MVLVLANNTGAEKAELAAMHYGPKPQHCLCF